MAGPLDRLERLMEEAVEGTVQRLFRPRLQPIQLAKAAAKAMERHHVIGPGGPEVPNHFAISLHGADHARFARFQLALEQELERYLIKYARDRGWRPVSRVQVALLADDSVPPGRPRVAAQMVDLAPEDGFGPELDPPLDRTMRQRKPPVEAVPDGSERAATAVLLGSAGQSFSLHGSLVRLGRALENDVVIPDARVSRYHAELRRQAAGWGIVDLGSTNGTLVADEPVEAQPLHDGDTISLGGYELVFRMTDSTTEV